VLYSLIRQTEKGRCVRISSFDSYELTYTRAVGYFRCAMNKEHISQTVFNFIKQSNLLLYCYNASQFLLYICTIQGILPKRLSMQCHIDTE
jgi:hypothetical protein